MLAEERDRGKCIEQPFEDGVGLIEADTRIDEAKFRSKLVISTYDTDVSTYVYNKSKGGTQL